MSRQLVQRELTPEGPLSTRGSRSARSVTVNLAESPLSWLHARGHLDDRLFAAGECLRADFERAGLAPSVTMRWEAVRHGRNEGPGGLHPTERQLAARERFSCAVDAAGRGLEDILWRVVCSGDSLPDVERALNWPARSGKLVLKIALDRVAEFYRIN